MAYDEELAHRIRAVLDVNQGVTEQRMFGGLSFLVGGNLAVSVRSGGGLLVRVGREQVADLLLTTRAQHAEMGSRTMADWVDVPAAELEESLAAWVRRGTSYAASLPPKG